MIKRRLLAPVDYVWSRDAAFKDSDRQALSTAWAKYREDLDDTHISPLWGDATPARFRLKPLTRRQLVAIDGYAKGLAADIETVAFGLVDVRGFEDAEGRPVGLRYEDIPSLGKRLTNDTIDDLYDVELFAELAQAILQRGRLSP